MRQRVTVTDLGLIPYTEAWQRQQDLLDERTANKLAGIPNSDKHILVLCEHPPVITLGKSGAEANLLLAPEFLEEKGIEFIHTNRGGDITGHNPGQLVGYPILDLEYFYTDIKRYMRDLEEVIIRTLSAYGVSGYRIEDATGVWVDSVTDGKPKKIAALGVRTSRWVTMHGFALNVDNDLSLFQYMVPCGISDKGVTSLKFEVRDTKFEVRMDEVKKVVLEKFAEVFNVDLVFYSNI